MSNEASGGSPAGLWLEEARRSSEAPRPTRAPPGGGAGAGAGSCFSLHLSSPSPLSTLRAVSSPTPEEVRGWFAERVEVTLPSEAAPLLADWGAELRLGGEQDVGGWGPGRDPSERLNLVAFLEEKLKLGGTFTFNALWRERQGGRMYPFWIPKYSGSLTISQRKYEEAGNRGPRHLLSAIRRDVRALLQPPPGWVLLEVDFRSCHPAIGLAVSGDPQLQRDLAGDIHQLIGDMLAARLDEPAARREFGKFVNNAMLFGLTPVGLGERARRALSPPPAHDLVVRVWNAWWDRYPQLRAFRDQLNESVRFANSLKEALEVIAPSGRVSRFSPAELGGRVTKGRGKGPGVDAVARSVFSACFRAIEADLLDQTIRSFRAGSKSGRLVLPLYDGLIAAAPQDNVVLVEYELKAAARSASDALGLEGLIANVKRLTPGG